jgi:hypothetical protein
LYGRSLAPAELPGETTRMLTVAGGIEAQPKH